MTVMKKVSKSMIFSKKTYFSPDWFCSNLYVYDMLAFVAQSV